MQSPSPAQPRPRCKVQGLQTLLRETPPRAGARESPAGKGLSHGHPREGVLGRQARG